MDSLRKIDVVRQDDDNLNKIWFHCQSADLFVWQEKSKQAIKRFEFYFDKPFAEQACVWKLESGISVRNLDDGESVSGRARTPILGDQSDVYKDVIVSKFNRVNRHLPAELKSFIIDKIQNPR